MSHMASEPFSPAEAAEELRPGRVGVEIIEQRLRVRLAPAFEGEGEAGVHLERLAAALRVADRHWMAGVLNGQLRVAGAPLGGGVVLIGHVAERQAVGVVRAQAFERGLRAFRRGLS